MKNFIKLFLIVISFFIPTLADAAGINLDVINNVNSYSQAIIDAPSKNQQIIDPALSKQDAHIAAANSKSLELTSAQPRKDNFSSGLTAKAGTQNRLLQQIFSKNYNKLFYSNSHKISSYLKNEICTRAP